MILKTFFPKRILINFMNSFKYTPRFSVLPQKVELNIIQSETMPKLVRKPDQQLICQWWSQTPFDMKSPLIVPIFSFQTGQYIGKAVELDKDIFNVPLRRDLVHRTLIWRRYLFKIDTHRSKTISEKHGTGRKQRPQKKTGKARFGYLRAPGKTKGAKAHGPKLRSRRQGLNKKIRLQALKIMLSSRLAEGKLRIIDSEAIQIPKTKVVHKIISQYDKTSKILIICGCKPDQNFQKAHKAIDRLQLSEPQRLNILKLLNSERIFITLDGLRALSQQLLDKTFLQYRIEHGNRKFQTESEKERQIFNPKKIQEKKPIYDPSKPLELKFTILKDYMERYEQLKKQGKFDFETYIKQRQQGYYGKHLEKLNTNTSADNFMKTNPTTNQ